jgi:hypothetical protein
MMSPAVAVFWKSQRVSLSSTPIYHAPFSTRLVWVIQRPARPEANC